MSSTPGALYEPFREAAEAVGLGNLVERIEAGYLERSPSGGTHWLYKCSETGGNTKLARHLSDEIDEATGRAIVKPLIEVRSGGGYIIVAPTNGRVHPTGGRYELYRGGFRSIAVITPEERQALWALARTFDRLPEAEQPSPSLPPARKGREWSDTITPWDDYESRTAWSDILRGWTLAHRHGETEYWRRPGKGRDHSATVNRNGSDRLYVFSTSTEFEAEKPYSKFQAYAHLDHRGDVKAAAKALSEAGYGTFKTWAKVDGERKLETRQNPCPKGVRLARPGEGPPTPERKPASGEESPARAEKPDDDRGETFAELSDADLGIVPLTSVDSRAIKWLWKYRLARGGLAMMAGDGGIGKSQVLLAIAAAVTNGSPWPDGAGEAPRGDVIIVSAEDRPDETIRPRLDALGAEAGRVTIVRAKFTIRRGSKLPQVHPASFQDLPYWKEVFRRRPGCLLFIVDPLPSYLGKGVNDSKNTEIRNVLEPFLDEVIAPADICMLGNTHLNKSVDAKTPMHRISGSIAYGNLPRNVHFVVRDPDDPERRFFQQAKCNNAPDNLPALAFRVERREVTNGQGEAIETAIPIFEAETVALDLGEAVNGTKAGKRGPAPKQTSAVAEWLHDFLSDQPGPTPIAAVFEAAGAAWFAGKKKENGWWSGVGTIYRAMEAVPSLAPPRDGRAVEEIEVPLKAGGRDIKHWYLRRAEAEF